MPRYRVLPYRQGSRAARALAEALGGRVLRLEGSRFIPRRDDILINYGNTDPRQFQRCTYNAVDLRHATNKLNFFRTMSDRGLADIIPRFWTDRTEIPDDAFPIVCRTVLAGHSGDGIVIAASRDQLVDAPLYVKYIKKQEEYRVHVGMRNGNTSIIAVQRKARRADTPDDQVNWQVRNHHNGFVFVRNGINPPPSVLESAQSALRAAGIDFGAVDVIWNARQERAYVLEINTAPGLEGQTVEDYANFFRGGNNARM